MKTPSASGMPAGRPTDPGPSRSAGRPRSEESRRAVLDAAYAILVEAGLGSFSTETVAMRSGVARTTIYRWWPTKGLLAIESFLEAFRAGLVYAETGDAVADFHTLTQSLVHVLSGPAGRIAASVVAQAQSDPETRRTFLEVFSAPLRRDSSKLLRRGISEGALRADLDAATVLDAVVGAVYLRLLLGQPLDVTWSRALSDTVLQGCLSAPRPPTPDRR